MVERTDLRDTQAGWLGVVQDLKGVLIQLFVVGPFFAALAVFLLVSFALPGSRGVGEIPYQMLTSIENGVRQATAPGMLGVERCLDEPAPDFPPTAVGPCETTSVEQVPLGGQADALGQLWIGMYLVGILIGAVLWGAYRGFLWSLSFMLPWNIGRPRHSA